MPAQGQCKEEHTLSAPASNDMSFVERNIRLMNKAEGFSVVIVCTSTELQASYWQDRLNSTRGIIAPKDALVLAVSEDWPGGAGNGLGTLYAYQKAVHKARKLFKLDLHQQLAKGSLSVALYHTSGKGTRLAPLPGAESNNKPGVKLPSILTINGKSTQMTILEAVIKQTGVYASSRRGRLSVFWGDQIFIPSNPVSYQAVHHIDILASLGDMPSEQEWMEKGLHKYGLIAVNEDGNAAQIDKVSHQTATRLLKSFGHIRSVGTSLGSFSVSQEFLSLLLDEFAAELVEKRTKLDADPHFWMPLTLERTAYIELMSQKGVAEDTSGSHFARMERMLSRLSLYSPLSSPSSCCSPMSSPQSSSSFATTSSSPRSTISERPLFGCVDVGSACYWWDYGQLALYLKNTLLVTSSSKEAEHMRLFLGLSSDSSRAPLASSNSRLPSIIDSCFLGTSIKQGSIKNSVVCSVHASDVSADSSLLINVTAKRVKTAKNCLLYNIVDDSEEGIELTEPGTVLVGLYLPSGERTVIRSSMSLCGGKKWSEIVCGNRYTFEQIHELNADADVKKIEDWYMTEHVRVAKTLGLLSLIGEHDGNNSCPLAFSKLSLACKAEAEKVGDLFSLDPAASADRRAPQAVSVAEGR